MPFVDVAERVSTRPEQLPASIRLKLRKSGRPACVVGLRRVILQKAKWTSCDVKLQIGSGEDAGKMRLCKAPEGQGVAPLRFLKKDSAVVDLGFIAAFGMKPKVSTAIEAKIVDPNTIELMLPNWEEVADAVDDDDPEEDPPARAAAPEPEKFRPEPRSPSLDNRAPRPQTPPLRIGNGHEAAKNAPPIEKFGVRVLFGPTPAIFYDGENLPLSDRQATFLGHLVRGLGQIMLTADLVQRMDIPASGGAAIVADEFEALKPRLAEIGLGLRHVQKMGYSLSKN